MIEKGKISAFQMGIMIYMVVVATADLLVPAVSFKEAKRDMWLSPFWASLTGFLIVYIIYRLNRIFPKKTIIEYSVDILGTIPGKILAFLYLFYYLNINGNIIRVYADFVVGVFYIKTPMVVVIASMVLVCAFAVRGGVEVLARAAQVFIPIVILLWVFTIVLIIPDLQVKNMFPLLEKGIMPSIKGSFLLQGWFTHVALLAILLPFLTDREKGMKSGMISVFIAMLILTLGNIIALCLFGGITGTFTYPLMEASRYISIADFLEHIHAIAMAVWVAGAFIKISLFYYALVLGSAQWLNLSDYRPLVFPLGFVLVLFALWSAPNMQELSTITKRSTIFYNNTFHTVIPILLLLIAVVRKRKKDTIQGK
ncbi:MAG TPA: endospore germination permease [Metabacillus sp.]|nr:endospore germination permease [Metabacillus sp.]